jgi:hypothetical protein
MARHERVADVDERDRAVVVDKKANRSLARLWWSDGSGSRIVVEFGV